MKNLVALGEELYKRKERWVQIYVSVELQWRNGLVDYVREEPCAGGG